MLVIPHTEHFIWRFAYSHSRCCRWGRTCSWCRPCAGSCRGIGKRHLGYKSVKIEILWFYQKIDNLPALAAIKAPAMAPLAKRAVKAKVTMLVKRILKVVDLVGKVEVIGIEKFGRLWLFEVVEMLRYCDVMENLMGGNSRFLYTNGSFYSELDRIAFTGNRILYSQLNISISWWE